MRRVFQCALLPLLCLIGSPQGPAQPVVCREGARCIAEPQQSPAILTREPVKRSPDVSVEVIGGSTDDRRLACAAVNQATKLLDRCGIALRRPLRVEIMDQVRHPLGGVIFGLFDLRQERVLITKETNITSLVEGTPYAKLPQADFYKSLVVHEITHGIMHQSLRRSAASNAAYEYPAYALQIESLPSEMRDTFLRSFDQAAIAADTIFNDTVLLFDPYFFAARAYHHFKTSADQCARLTALLEGQVDFIAPQM
jgi:hypothetical protein